MKKEIVRNKIDEIARLLYEKYNANKVILFGSYAYGKPHEYSDIDLLIIKETKERPIDRIVYVKRLVRNLREGIPFSPIVMTPTELDNRLKIGDQFIEEIIEQGVEIR